MQEEQLPVDFLIEIAREYDLTPLEQEAFIETFRGNETDQVIIRNLKITLPAYRARMGNIYAKFSFRDGGRGKRHRLQYFLLEQYKKRHPTKLIPASYHNTDALVDELNERLKDKIHNECSTMRVLDMTQPLELSTIFTEVNILEQVSGSQRRRIDDLLKDFHLENNRFDNFGLSQRPIQKVSGIDYVQQQEKLVILGKPGAGKTTFLKHVAMQCCDRNLFPQHLPIFITLKDFAEAKESPSLLEYINQTLQFRNIHDYEIEHLLKERRVLLLLDGLDEVKPEDAHRIKQQIQTFTENCHGNRFILTCRIAAQEYLFEQFTEVEVADFNKEQVETFSRNWFLYKQTPDKAEHFLDKLQQNPPIQELATNPLLLTLLCLVFEEQADFPASRAELYEEGINTLLRRWDASRNIERGQLYQDLSVARKKGMLSHIALKAFERSEIFFKKQTLASYIADYIVNLPGTRRRRLLPYEIEHQGELVLKSIEAQHGLFVERAYDIYSFSHLSFQEYFAAKAIASECELERLHGVVEQIRNKQWHEVFLLAVSMSSRADGLMSLMKQKTDEILYAQPRLLKFLAWLNEKVEQVQAKSPIYFIRAFYFMYSFSQDEVISPLNFKPIHPEMDLDRALILLLNNLTKVTQISLSEAGSLELWQSTRRELDTVNQMVQTTPTADDAFPQGWASIFEALQPLYSRSFTAAGLEALQVWVDKLRSHISAHRNVGYAWNFSDRERTTLNEYYSANKLLLDCLNGDCYVSRHLQKQIREALFVQPH